MEIGSWYSLTDCQWVLTTVANTCMVVNSNYSRKLIHHSLNITYEAAATKIFLIYSRWIASVESRCYQIRDDFQDHIAQWSSHRDVATTSAAYALWKRCCSYICFMCIGENFDHERQQQSKYVSSFNLSAFFRILRLFFF